MSAISEFHKLREAGVTLPGNPLHASSTARRMSNVTNEDTANSVKSILRRQSMKGYSGSNYGVDSSGTRLGSTGSTRAGGNTDYAFAYAKEQDPFEYWQKQLDQWGNLRNSIGTLQDYMRLLYATHPLVPSLIDIYSRFPILDLEFKHHDEGVTDFYNQLFLDELDLQEHLYQVSKEKWLTGESFPLGSWHDGIGAWDGFELINPQDVEIKSNTFLPGYDFRIAPPQGIKDVVKNRNPVEEYELLTQLYPDLVKAVNNEQTIPVSGTLMKHIKFETDPWTIHGTPILLRAFRHLMLEESLLNAQEAFADRFYAPLIQATLGLEKFDDQGGWIPDREEITALRNDLYAAMQSDFRLISHHHGLDIKTVLGGDRAPQLERDFERIDTKLMQVFGISKELLQGGSRANTPYATTALNRELITSLLTTYQLQLKKYVYERCRAVAERQGHYEYEQKGDRRIPIMERILVQDEETGKEYVEERPKLAIPELSFRTLNLRDEAQERGFLSEMERSGFPLSNQAKAMHTPVNYEEELERSNQERIEEILAEQRFKEQLFRRLYAEGIEAPEEHEEAYQQWLESKKSPIEGEGSASEDAQPSGDKQRPEESDEQRDTMPTASVQPYVPADAHDRVSAHNGHAQANGHGHTHTEKQVRESILNSEASKEIHEQYPPAKYDEITLFGSDKKLRSKRKMALPSSIRISESNGVESGKEAKEEYGES